MLLLCVAWTVSSVQDGWEAIGLVIVIGAATSLQTFFEKVHLCLHSPLSKLTVLCICCCCCRKQEAQNTPSLLFFHLLFQCVWLLPYSRLPLTLSGTISRVLELGFPALVCPCVTTCCMLSLWYFFKLGT